MAEGVDLTLLPTSLVFSTPGVHMTSSSGGQISKEQKSHLHGVSERLSPVICLLLIARHVTPRLRYATFTEAVILIS